MDDLSFESELRRVVEALTLDDIQRAAEGRPKRVRKGYRPKMLPTIALYMNQGPKGPFGEFIWRLNVTDNPRGKFISIARRDPVLLSPNIIEDGIAPHLQENYADYRDVWTRIFWRYCKVRGIVCRMERQTKRHRGGRRRAPSSLLGSP